MAAASRFLGEYLPLGKERSLFLLASSIDKKTPMNRNVLIKLDWATYLGCSGWPKYSKENVNDIELKYLRFFYNFILLNNE